MRSTRRARPERIAYIADPTRPSRTALEALGSGAVAAALRVVADDLAADRQIARDWVEDGELLDLPALARYLRLRDVIDSAGHPVRLPGVFAATDWVSVTAGRYAGRRGRVVARQSNGTYVVARLRGRVLEFFWGWAVLAPDQLRHAD
ncbi:hypothetical protein [Kitasatospora kifunensis]|uniref:Uncharacterized protein n=1 Tax=Kitasatospora kifunensis TaxID=58351 RepID=A0A7W7RBV9_KITKI|nr:hypothetical protein [Kitasatospora kifunensis]MBB4929170.1 hypothetical protein [Kitasatospora kifunensis]